MVEHAAQHRADGVRVELDVGDGEREEAGRQLGERHAEHREVSDGVHVTEDVDAGRAHDARVQREATDVADGREGARLQLADVETV